ncbi:MAG: SelB C-terminal domain-containing protein, partial [Candidatus Eremiobacteraeota bacterium]|nr:SelB C-terminal domain-containing protein [Candidatus Eremiobacteraeota bacterium]
PVEGGLDFSGSAARVIEAAGLEPVTATQVAAALNVVLAKARDALAELAAAGAVVELRKPDGYIGRAAADAALARVNHLLEQRHSRAPWLLGVAITDVARELGTSDALAGRLLTAWHEDGQLALTGRYWHKPDQQPAYSAQQRDFFARELRADAANPLLPVSYDQLAQRAAAARIDGLKDAIETLLATGALVRIGDDVYRRAQLARARELLGHLLKDGSGATMAQVRDAFGTSRRYALPLMEYFDGIGVTMRDGDIRRLRKITRPQPAR